MHQGARRRWRALLCAALLAGAAGCKRTATASATPRLVVLVVVDQLRADEIETYKALWQFGFRRLRDEGRWYTHGAHTHGRTETAAGHATLGTGVLPRHHGVVDKVMYLRDRHKALGICDFGGGPCNADALQVPTLGDRLKAARPESLVVALAEKARSANLLGGRAADLVAWHSEDQIALVGRGSGAAAAGAAGPVALTNGLPAWIHQFFQRVAAPDRIARIWELPRLPEPFASRPDNGPLAASCGHGPKFPHRLTARTGPALVAQWHCTPDSDRAVTETAMYVARHLQLGKDDVPDLLLVSLAAVDIVGHSFGYESLERVAVLTELDRQLGDLLDGLREWVGPQLVVGLSADHGVAPRVDTARAQGHDSGRVSEAVMVQKVEAALQVLGPGPHVAALTFPFLHLVDLPEGERVRAANLAAAALRTLPQVYKAWTQADLTQDLDPIAKLMQANIYPGRAGDVVITLKPYYVNGAVDTGASHGTPWDYDRQVPILLWGDGVQPGKVDTPVAVIDLVRTLADRLGLPADPLGGTPLP